MPQLRGSGHRTKVNPPKVALCVRQRSPVQLAHGGPIRSLAYIQSIEDFCVFGFRLWLVHRFREMNMDRRLALHHFVVGAAGIGLAALLTGCKPQSIEFKGIDITGADYAKDFPLPDAQGRVRSIHDFAGKVVVVFFGYTQCPDVCPTTLQELAEVKAALGAHADKLQGVFISLDPERDTPEVLRAYTEAFDPSMVALTGTPEQLAAVAKDFKVFFKKVAGRQPGSYSLDHSAGLYVYDPKGQLRVYHRYGQGLEALTADVQTLLGTSPPK